jgi:hypothetical protein
LLYRRGRDAHGPSNFDIRLHDRPLNERIDASSSPQKSAARTQLISPERPGLITLHGMRPETLAIVAVVKRTPGMSLHMFDLSTHDRRFPIDPDRAVAPAATLRHTGTEHDGITRRDGLPHSSGSQTSHVISLGMSRLLDRLSPSPSPQAADRGDQPVDPVWPQRFACEGRCCGLASRSDIFQRALECFANRITRSVRRGISFI